MRIEDYIAGTLHDQGMERHQADILSFSFLERNDDLRTSEPVLKPIGPHYAIKRQRRGRWVSSGAHPSR